MYGLTCSRYCPRVSLRNEESVYITIGYFELHFILTRKVLVATTDAQWEGMGDVGSARYEPALLPPCPTIRVLS